MRMLDKKRPYVEVFGDAEPPHRYRQFGMLFDEQGQLIGDELPVPEEQPAETPEAMRARIEAEVRAKVMAEIREQQTAAARTGGGDEAAAGKPAVDPDLPGELGKGEATEKTTVVGRRRAA